MSNKEKFIRNDFCIWMNDGFNCPMLKDDDNIRCAQCLTDLIHGMTEDLLRLLEEIENEKKNVK